TLLSISSLFLLLVVLSMLPERLFALSLVVWGFLQAPALAQPALRYKFKEGENLRYDVQQTGGLKVKADGMEIEATFALSMDVVWEVLEVDRRSGTAWLAFKAERLRLEVFAQGMQQVIDSANPKTDEEKEVVGALAEGIKVRMASNGKILD